MQNSMLCNFNTIVVTYKNCMKQEVQIASPVNLHTVVNYQVSQQNHCYVTPKIKTTVMVKRTLYSRQLFSKLRFLKKINVYPSFKIVIHCKINM